MADCRLEQFGNGYHTFLTRRFDRAGNDRLHFSSAMTQLAYDDGQEGASYLELAEFLTRNGANAQVDLEQLWRRIVFSIAVSNTDDHLRNHGFILTPDGWVLSPAYDLNLEPAGQHLSLFISDTDGRLDVDLAMSVAEFFQVDSVAARRIRDEVGSAVDRWRDVARQIGIKAADQKMIAPAFSAVS